MSEEMPEDAQGKIIVFGSKQIRRGFVDGEWYFSVVDVIAALTESTAPAKYWDAMKRREKKGSGVDLSTLCRKVKLTGADGKAYRSDAVNTEKAFRLIQSIPSPHAEPFKRWLAEVGYERVQEIENPELAQQRMRELYKAKGYPDDWIEKRVRSIAVRDELTNEWKTRGIAEQRDFAILTAEISKATFGLTPNDYKRLKGLKRENLRDHMNDLELIFTMLGEAATTEIARKKDALGMAEYDRGAARRGGGRQRPPRTGAQERQEGRHKGKLPDGKAQTEEIAAAGRRGAMSSVDVANLILNDRARIRATPRRSGTPRSRRIQIASAHKRARSSNGALRHLTGHYGGHPLRPRRDGTVSMMHYKAPALFAALLIAAGCASHERAVPKAPLSGADAARRDIAAGRLELHRYGLIEQRASAFARRLRETCGVEVVSIAGCTIDAPRLEESQSYNRVMTAEIERRFGPRIIDRLWNEAATAPTTHPAA